MAVFKARKPIIRKAMNTLSRKLFLGFGQGRAATITVNLQLFAGEGEKTEKATPKRKQDARKKGQVLQSKEISSALVMMLVFLSLKLLGNYMYREINSLLPTVFQ